MASIEQAANGTDGYRLFRSAVFTPFPFIHAFKKALASPLSRIPLSSSLSTLCSLELGGDP